MKHSSTFVLDSSWKLLLKDLEIDTENVLKRSCLPLDLFCRDSPKVTTAEYFRLWKALEEETQNPDLGLVIGKMISVEHFSPPLFAALCSPYLSMALRRIAQFKRLFAAMELDVKEDVEGLHLSICFCDTSEKIPESLLVLEIVFFVQFARIATREQVVPLVVLVPFVLKSTQKLEAFLGISIQQGEELSICFSGEDATRPFLTHNPRMWDFFEPELQKRLGQLGEGATTVEKVQGALLELLPSGRSTLKDVAKALKTSVRTLQRRLREESTNFQWLLATTRCKLAEHYLKTSSLSSTEIAFLLGFEDPNSFYRAFHVWTGQTPEQQRMLVNS